MNKMLVTTVDGSKFVTNRFGTTQLTDNVNIANTYESTDRLGIMIAAYSLLFGIQLMSDKVSNHYKPMGV